MIKRSLNRLLNVHNSILGSNFNQEAPTEWPAPVILHTRYELGITFEKIVPTTDSEFFFFY
jgi:hypothetical protein